MADHRVDVLRLPMSVTAFAGACYALVDAYPDVELKCRGIGDGDEVEIFYEDEPRSPEPEPEPEEPVDPPHRS
jgi:hypothetical protein